MTNLYSPVVADCEITATMSLDDKGNWVHVAAYKKQQAEIEQLRGIVRYCLDNYIPFAQTEMRRRAKEALGE